ncbi:MAG TPA: AIR synthase related protein, partial [Candidatus Baltobacteraceae bacterium]|nr:AIR synthase related protein [Candidatus Baltobacteraceae bacterium]
MRNFAVAGRSDDELRRAAAESGLALRADELRRIAERLGRDPTMVEAHAFDAQWSEHCSYKSSRHLLRALPTEGPSVMQGPAEDAGILHLGEFDGAKWGVVIAHESHNHPSQVVPFEGAATGVGGIVRDVLCMGAEVIAIADPLRFGRVEDPDSHQRYVAQGAVDGISAYGNAIGIPNVAGDVYFDERFDDNCLVNVVALGLIKESDIIHSAAPPHSEGWDIVLVGKATDTSGFGGASFSSVTLDEEDADANKGAVQVPDPFLKNVIMRATYRVFEYVRERGLTVGFKDLGAGGIMGCTAELCGSGGFGAIIDLDDVNTAIKNMPPEVIAVGETQERLCWILPGDVTADVLQIYNTEFSLPEIARGACATVIGCVQGEKRYVMRHGDEIVMDVPIDFLTGTIRDELPIRAMSERKVTDPARRYVEGPYDLAELFPRVLAHRDVCSREPLFDRYDAVVRGTTVIPRGRACAGVIAPLDGS